MKKLFLATVFGLSLLATPATAIAVISRDISCQTVQEAKDEMSILEKENPNAKLFDLKGNDVIELAAVFDIKTNVTEVLGVEDDNDKGYTAFGFVIEEKICKIYYIPTIDFKKLTGSNQ